MMCTKKFPNDLENRKAETVGDPKDFALWNFNTEMYGAWSAERYML